MLRDRVDRIVVRPDEVQAVGRECRRREPPLPRRQHLGQPADAALQAIPQLLPQFHGDESPQACSRAARPYLRAARMAAGFDLLDFAFRFSDAQALLLDAHVDGYGGGGKVFDWSVIPHNVPLPVVLSGGLHAGNVIPGIQLVRPWAVDVSSGVESAKGIKDAEAIRRFCDAVREADARIAASVA